MKILNLYSGLGGNRKFWSGDITAVEINPQIAAVYKRHYPTDTVIIGDAHQYLLEHADEFDFIWSSPPCQKHTRMMKATRHKTRHYPDMALYQEIIFLQHFFKGKYVVENVIPYYDMLLPAVTRGRHVFWANFPIPLYDEPTPPDFINKCTTAGKKELQDWLGIHYDENIYYEGNHCPAQILRNCVHPEVGNAIFNAAISRDDILESLIKAERFIAKQSGNGETEFRVPLLEVISRAQQLNQTKDIGE